ncbi:MAG: pyridoxal phosphate-dependent aminotransferase [Myxococcota bacterium]
MVDNAAWTKKLSQRVMQLGGSATLQVSKQAAQLRQQGHRVVDLGVGEPSCPTPSCILSAAMQALQQSDISHYTAAAGLPDLLTALQQKLARDQGLQYNTSQLLVTPGAKAALSLTFDTLLQPGDEVILFAPYWTSYKALVQLAGATPVVVPTHAQDGYLPNMQALQQALSDKTKVVLINSPANPSGALWSKQRLQQLWQLLQQRPVWVVSDEIYSRFVFDGLEYVSPASLSREAYERTVVIDGVSKTYAMTGWRIGCVAASDYVISHMLKLHSQRFTCATALAQYAASFALSEGRQVAQAVQQMRQNYQRRRDTLLPQIKQLPHIGCSTPQGAFYLLLDISAYIGRSYGNITIADDVTFCQQLLQQQHVATVAGSAFGTPGTVRLSFAADDAQLGEGIARIKTWLRQLH